MKNLFHNGPPFGHSNETFKRRDKPIPGGDSLKMQLRWRLPGKQGKAGIAQWCMWRKWQERGFCMEKLLISSAFGSLSECTEPEVMLLWSAGVWELLSPSGMTPRFTWQKKNRDNWKMNACSATKQDLLSYHRFYAKYAERIRITRRPLLLLLIVIKTCNTQGVAAIFQFTDKMGASLLLMVTERLFTCPPTLTPFRASSYRSVCKNVTKGATCECLVKKQQSHAHFKPESHAHP